MTKFYLCSENHSVLGTMDTYLNFHRQLDSEEKTHPSSRRPLPNTENDRSAGRWKSEGGPNGKVSSRWNHADAEKGFNPQFPSLQDLSDESTRPRQNYLSDGDNSPYQLGREHPSDEALNKIRSANTVTMTPELFEKLYLNPQNKVTGDLRSTFANPTPIGLLGFLLAGSPLACAMMGWRGAGGGGVAMVAVYYFVGGLLMSLGGLLEFFLGNTFSFVVFLGYGKFLPLLDISKLSLQSNYQQVASGSRWAVP